MVRIFTCTCCRCRVPANPRIKNQRFCGKAPCQRDRKRRWQQAKMATDPDYRANQRDAQNNWRKQNPNYRRKPGPIKRASPPHSVDSNSNSTFGKMDALSVFSYVETGEYIISPIGETGRKMDALRVKIVALTGG